MRPGRWWPPAPTWPAAGPWPTSVPGRPGESTRLRSKTRCPSSSPRRPGGPSGDVHGPPVARTLGDGSTDEVAELLRIGLPVLLALVGFTTWVGGGPGAAFPRSAGSRIRTPASADSWPTPPTSSDRRWPSSASTPRWPSPTRSAPRWRSSPGRSSTEDTRMQRLVEDLLLLARADERHAPRPPPAGGPRRRRLRCGHRAPASRLPLRVDTSRRIGGAGARGIRTNSTAWCRTWPTTPPATPDHRRLRTP